MGNEIISFSDNFWNPFQNKNPSHFYTSLHGLKKCLFLIHLDPDIKSDITAEFLVSFFIAWCCLDSSGFGSKDLCLYRGIR